MMHDPVSEFVYAFALVLFFNITTIIPRIMQLYWWMCARPLSFHRVGASAGVGIIEQTLYVYCLASTHREFIGSILIFKAFFNWLSLAPPNVAATQDDKQQISHAVSVRQHRYELLEIFYAYAIGNFLSLAIAILLYEAVHLWLIRVFPALPLSFLHS